jgi:F420H(2)-dependent quinone reductase
MRLAPMNSLLEKAFAQVLRVHDAVYRKTNGWIGHRTLWIPSLLLHTVGAKTRKQRTTSLTYARDGDDYLVVASKGGAPQAPGWYHNLKADPDAEINVGPRQIVNKNNGNRYIEYQNKTSRPIPVVVLTPRA